MATYNGIKVYQLSLPGATHAQDDTVLGVYDMDVVDNGGTSGSGQPFSDQTLHEGQYYYFNSGQSFSINGTDYVDVIYVDTGSIEIDSVVIDGALVDFVDPSSGNTLEFFIPLQADAADAYTVEAGDTITTAFVVDASDADQIDYADMYTGYTPPLDYIVEGTAGDDLIDDTYTGDPEGDMIDASDHSDGSDIDSVEAGDGNDTILSGDGRDTVYGGAGDDSISGGAGMDSIYGEGGNDTINTGADGALVFPGDGHDFIQGSDANDRVEPSAGNDTMIGGLGNDQFWGGDGDDSIDSGAGSDAIRAGDGNDTIDSGVGYGSDDVFGLLNAGSGNDLVYVGDGGASVTAEDGDDTIYGAANFSYINAGAGSDLIIDGGGPDTVLGGDGADEIRLTGGDTTVYTGDGSNDDSDDVVTWNGAGDVQIRDFGSGDSGSIDDGVQSNNDYLDLSAFYSGYTEMRADFNDDSILNQSVGDYSDNTAITGSLQFLDVSGTQYMTASGLTYDNTNVTCFAADVRVLTMLGECRVDDIKKGDFVLTMDHGYRPVRWVGRRVVSSIELDANPHLHPIRIAKGALGNNTPCRDLVVSPQHRIYLRSHIIQRMTGHEEGLVAAKHLLGMPGIEIAYDLAEITYVHIMFDAHEVIYSEGAASESFYTGSVAMRTLDQAARGEILELFPELALDDCPAPTPARPLLPGRIGRKIAARHAKNAKPLVA